MNGGLRKLMGRAPLVVLLMSTAAALVSACSGGTTVPGDVYEGDPAERIKKALEERKKLMKELNMSQMEGTGWYAQSFTTVAMGGLLPPLSDGGSHPEAPVTAEAAITTLVRLLGIAAVADPPEIAIAKAEKAGLITGPVFADHNMTRVEIAQIIARSKGIQPAPVTAESYPFADSTYLSPADMGIIKALYDAGIFKGYREADGTYTFHPYSVMSRAEFTIVLHRFAGVAE